MVGIWFSFQPPITLIWLICTDFFRYLWKSAQISKISGFKNPKRKLLPLPTQEVTFLLENTEGSVAIQKCST
jgi:hypothetical protein